MASPLNVTIWNLNGKWMGNKSKSDDPEPSLKLQGISWAFRKAIVCANPVACISAYTSTREKTPTTYIDTVISTPVANILDARVLNWQTIKHTDFIFGSVNCQTTWIAGLVGEEGRTRPSIQESIGDEKATKFLRGEILADGSKCDGFLVEEGHGKEEALWIHTIDQHEDGHWMDEMMWGFELIDGERYHTRRVITMENKTGRYELVRVVLLFIE